MDKKNLQKFYKKANCKKSIISSEYLGILFNFKNLIKFNKNYLLPLDLKKYAHVQLLNENIPNKNIDISDICTYESNIDFYSWRRSKTLLRQWNFISP